MCSYYGLVYEVLKKVICKISKRQTNYVQYPLNYCRNKHELFLYIDLTRNSIYSVQEKNPQCRFFSQFEHIYDD